MKKYKPSPLEQIFIKFAKILGKIIKRKMDTWKEKRNTQKEFDKEVKINIKKNRMYAKAKNIKRHSLDEKDGDLY